MADSENMTEVTIPTETDDASEAATSVQLDELTRYIADSLHIEPGWVWMTQIFVIVLLTLIASYVANLFLTRMRHRLEKTKTIWDDTLLEAARKPLRTLVWVIGLCYAMEIIYLETGVEIFAAVGAVRDVAVIAIFAWWMLRFINTFKDNLVQHRIEQGKEVDETTVSVVSKLLKASIIITSALMALQTLGFSVGGVLAFGGIGGMAVGFAAKDMLANFFGAMMVYFDRPFKVGEWIRSPDKEIEGTVEEIGWRQTRIRTFDKRPIYVPNALFTTIVVENPSRMSNRRIYETIGIRYDDIEQMESITDKVRDMLKNHSEIDANQTLMVYFNAFNASSVDFFVYCFTHTTNWGKYHEVKHEVLLKISDIIASHGAEIAFPTRTLHMLNDAPEEKPAPAKKKPATKAKTKKKAA